MNPEKPGQIVIISSPSGGGKTSICRELLSPERKKAGWTFSISYTTREKRPNEEDGREYYFVNDEEFERKVDEDFFAEHFKVHLYNYGTPREPIEKIRRKGGVMIFDVDVQGAQRLKQEYPDAISIFVMPPSQEILRQRLSRRGTETEEQLKVRLENALKEMRTFKQFDIDYVVINEELSRAVSQVLSIIEAHPCRIERFDSEQLRKISG